jgi:exonuclease III
MKLISWNCNQALKKKFPSKYFADTDILIIQECENIESSFFTGYKFFRMGDNKKKGLGILVRDKTARLYESFQSKFIYFFPIVTDDVNILGVWAYNHRASKFGERFVGNALEALSYYKEWLQEKDKAFVVGDFNNSVIWDKPSGRNNFEEIDNFLKSLNFQSAYHEKTGDPLGREKQATFYHTKKKEKPHHIDYIYYKGFKAVSVAVSEYDDWINLSDHMPVYGEFL